MTEPIDAVRAIHNAFRRDMAIIDAAALDAARGKPGLEATVERFRFMEEVLEWHAHGEELAIFPALEDVAPCVAEAYEKDHRALDAAFETLSNAVSACDPIETARATKAFKYFLDVHLDKEDGHLYRLIRERVPMPDQGQAVGVMASTVPQDRFPELVAWMFPLMGHDDRENMTRIWQHVMPPEAFAGATQLVAAAIGDDYSELSRRIPELAGALSESRTGGPEPLVRVGDDFEDEYPGANALATECWANLWRAADLLMGLHNRHTADRHQLSPSARGVLAVVEGAGQPLEPSVIAERLVVTTGSMTSLLDNLEKRHLIRRLPHPDDRRKLLIDITPEAREIVDDLLPSLHAREREVIGAALTASEQRTLLRYLAKLQQAATDAQTAPAPEGAIRRRPPAKGRQS